MGLINNYQKVNMPRKMPIAFFLPIRQNETCSPEFLWQNFHPRMDMKNSHLLDETLITFKQARSLDPPVSRATLYRWMRDGILDDTRIHRVYLETIKHGGRRYTSIEAVIRFTEALSE